MKPIRKIGLAALAIFAMPCSGQASTLRLMPVGDSITSGFQGTNNNGYRGTLYNSLVSQGHQTDFVGGVRDGNVFDPDHEGRSGWRIDQVAAQLNGALSSYQPNIVTLHIGSNDMGQNYQVSTAPNRLASMIDQILAGSPGVTVVVSQLTPNSDPAVQARINAYNSQMPGIVQARVNAGKKVYLINMNSDRPPMED